MVMGVLSSAVLVAICPERKFRCTVMEAVHMAATRRLQSVIERVVVIGIRLLRASEASVINPLRRFRDAHHCLPTHSFLHCAGKMSRSARSDFDYFNSYQLLEACP